MVGEGGRDLIYLAPWFSHVEFAWAEPRKARFFWSLAAFTRLVLFDRRGQGLSDPEASHRVATIETRCDDIVAVLDAVGSSGAIVYGASETGPMAALFAALHPARTAGLVIHGPDPARSAWAPDWPHGRSATQQAEAIDLIDREWGTQAFIHAAFPALANDQPLVEYLAGLQRHSMSPGAAVTAERWSYEIDVRDALPLIHVPTLILNRRDDEPLVSQFYADHISGARHVQLPGREHIPYLGDQSSVTAAIEQFVESLPTASPAIDRALATLVCVRGLQPHRPGRAAGGGAHAHPHGPRADLLTEMVGRFRGRLLTGPDGEILAVFDGATRALACAMRLVGEASRRDRRLQVGVHAGEVAVVAGRVTGPAVAIASMLAAIAGPQVVLASPPVRDLTIGSELVFDRGADFRPVGVTEPWPTYRVSAPADWTWERPFPTSRAPISMRSDGTAGDAARALTPREREVLELLATGRSDGEIAAALFISKKTASVHVSNIKGKLGARNRVDIALLARRDRS